MKKLNHILAVLFLLSWGSAAMAQTVKKGEGLRSSAVIDYWVTREEIRLVAVADAMPADKYPFAPGNGEFKGVRTFAQQLKHVAADNYISYAVFCWKKQHQGAPPE